MLDRRTFVESSLALPVVSLAAGAGVSARAAATPGVLALERFVFDARFAEAADVAEHVERLDVPLAPIAGDLLELWYGELDLRWREAPMVLAGVTTPEGLFVLETLAMDHRMRVVYRGEHGVVRDSILVHKLKGPAEVLEMLGSLPEDAAWPAALAIALTRCPLGSPEAAELELVTQVGGISLRDVPLFSWIIAPRTVVALTIES